MAQTHHTTRTRKHMCAAAGMAAVSVAILAQATFAQAPFTRGPVSLPRWQQGAMAAARRGSFLFLLLVLVLVTITATTSKCVGPVVCPSRSRSPPLWWNSSSAIASSRSTPAMNVQQMQRGAPYRRARIALAAVGGRSVPQHGRRSGHMRIHMYSHVIVSICCFAQASCPTPSLAGAPVADKSDPQPWS